MAETGGMIALIPDRPGDFVVPGGHPEPEIHLTLAYLGERDEWPDEVADAIGRELQQVAQTAAPIGGEVFGHALWNPGPDAAAVHELQASEDLDKLNAIACEMGRAHIGDALWPVQHSPFRPHVTGGYGISPDLLSFTGDFTMSTIRLALGDRHWDFRLTGSGVDPENVMTAATAVKVPITIPVVIIEGMRTADGRYIEPGALSHRALPLHVLAQTQNPVGGDGHDGAYVVAQLETLERVPGPEVVSKETGQPFPEGTFVWRGSGWVNPNLTGADYVLGSQNADTGAWEGGVLRGNSADLSEVEAEYEYDEGEQPTGLRITRAVIAATTLVPIPAFADGYVTVDTVDMSTVEAPDGAVAASVWRSDELGDEWCVPCAEGAVTAAAGITYPPVAVFADPELSEYTPITLRERELGNGLIEVVGHIAQWGVCHNSFADRCRTAPKSGTDYAYFNVGAARAAEPDGSLRDVAVGHITMNAGHAPLTLDARQTAAFYDDTSTVVADVAAGEDDHGIWVHGIIRRGTDPHMVEALRASPLSGDWRPIRGVGLELVAAHAVNTPGFTVPRARVASGALEPVPSVRVRVSHGEPVALVAAALGRTLPDGSPAPTGVVMIDYDQLSDGVAHRLAGTVPITDREDVGAAVVLDYDQLANRIAARLQGAVPLPGTGQEGSASLRSQFAELYTELGAERIELDALAAFADASGATDEVLAWFGGEEEFKRRNWVDKAGGLPPYIRRIAKHLQKKGMTESHAIATAVNQVEKMCSTGDVNFPGKQNVNPGSRAEACADVASWERKKASA